MNRHCTAPELLRNLVYEERPSFLVVAAGLPVHAKTLPRLKPCDIALEKVGFRRLLITQLQISAIGRNTAGNLTGRTHQEIDTDSYSDASAD